MPFEEGLMKGILIAISGTIVLMSSTVYGHSGTQVIDHPQMNQEDWIERSFDRGQPNRREAAQVDLDQAPIDRGESMAKADGVVTRKEAARIGAAKKRTPRPIVRERHARQGAPHR